jgi:hypothetical protein
VRAAAAAPAAAARRRLSYTCGVDAKLCSILLARGASRLPASLARGTSRLPASLARGTSRLPASLARGRVCFCALGLLLLGACTVSKAGRVPAHYPALPAGTSVSSEAPSFEPGATLTEVRIACRDAEPPLANGLDDDCDGQIDGVAAADTLVLALAYARSDSAPPKLALRADETHVIELAAPACDATSPFCTMQLSGQNLARGRHTLVVQSADPATNSESRTLLVSVQGHGKVASYLAAVAAGGHEQPLGQLALP